MATTARAISKYRKCSPSLIAAIEKGDKRAQADFVIAAGNVMVESEPDRTPHINDLLAAANLPTIDSRLMYEVGE